MGRTPRKYLILDTETATLPFVNGMVSNSLEKRKLAIAKPLIYDIAWKIIDRNGKVYSEHCYLVAETFSVPSIFNTAYYKEKRPVYIERLEKKETCIKPWGEIMNILIEDLEHCDFVGAFNSMFDFKKAIPFTEKYINALYSTYYYNWEKAQKYSCENILRGVKYENKHWDGNNFEFREKKYPLIDLWGISCEMIINTDRYKRQCLKHSMVTESGQYFKSSAETTFRYLCNKFDFEELHMAIDDVNIECEILQKALKKGKITEGLQYFPFQMLGKTSVFILSKEKRRIPVAEVENVVKVIESKLQTYENYSTFAVTLEREMYRLINYLNERYAENHNYVIKGYEIELREITRREEKLKLEIQKLKTVNAIEKREQELEKLYKEYKEIEFKISSYKRGE